MFPSMRLTVPRPTGVNAAVTDGANATAKARQAAALAKLTVSEAEGRLVLDWATSLRHGVFYKAVYQPAVLRANRRAADMA